ncbi:hypothetical protein ES703_64284 [subsurface metagenome]
MTSDLLRLRMSVSILMPTTSPITMALCPLGSCLMRTFLHSRVSGHSLIPGVSITLDGISCQPAISISFIPFGTARAVNHMWFI